MKTMLIVEDDPSIILFYQRVFSKTSIWSVTYSDSFYQGLSLLEASNYDCVLSDGVLRDESMNGIEFLTKVKNLYPYILRFLVSGTIYPKGEEYSSFHIFIDKKNLNGRELIEIINYMCDEIEELSDHLTSKIMFGFSSKYQSCLTTESLMRQYGCLNSQF